MSVDMAALTADLAAESAELYEVLSVLAEPDWARDTPAAGWTVRDQVTHLAFFDEAAVRAATEPEAFAAEVAALAEQDPDRVAERYRGLSGAEAFAWLQQARRAYLDVFAALDGGTKLPWYGPPMSAASSVTARLMETWAHGQDVHDALGLVRRPTARLRHVAHLGVRTLGWSFAVRGLPAPGAPVRVELTGPDGEPWTWGPDDAADRVTGPAEDFCLLVVQRRHRGQTALVAEGPVADRWLDVAQAFAGPPGPGRAPEAGG
ncbi:TIGR03084 family metal-binding protein [Geodermatophilus sp. SYSU D00691]